MTSIAAFCRTRTHQFVAAITVGILLAAGAVVAAPTSLARDSRSAIKPTIVLVHGNWADASGWSGVVVRLQHDGYPVYPPPNPLRSLSADAAYLSTFLDSIPGPIVLVGHSYGGAVITNAATGHPNVRALVYVDGFAPDQGEFVTQLAGADSAVNVPDPTTVFAFVPATQPMAPTTDVYLKTSVFVTSFANGVPADQARILAAEQRPSSVQALFEPSGVPAWKTIPSWYVLGTRDHIITPAAQKFMAERAGSTIAYIDAGHLGLVSDPHAVTRVIERAARATD